MCLKTLLVCVLPRQGYGDGVTPLKIVVNRRLPLRQRQEDRRNLQARWNLLQPTPTPPHLSHRWPRVKSFTTTRQDQALKQHRRHDEGQRAKATSDRSTAFPALMLRAFSSSCIRVRPARVSTLCIYRSHLRRLVEGELLELEQPQTAQPLSPAFKLRAFVNVDRPPLIIVRQRRTSSEAQGRPHGGLHPISVPSCLCLHESISSKVSKLSSATPRSRAISSIAIIIISPVPLLLLTRCLLARGVACLALPVAKPAAPALRTRPKKNKERRTEEGRR